MSAQIGGAASHIATHLGGFELGGLFLLGRVLVRGDNDGEGGLELLVLEVVVARLVVAERDLRLGSGWCRGETEARGWCVYVGACGRVSRGGGRWCGGGERQAVVPARHGMRIFCEWRKTYASLSSSSPPRFRLAPSRFCLRAARRDLRSAIEEG